MTMSVVYYCIANHVTTNPIECNNMPHVGVSCYTIHIERYTNVFINYMISQLG